METALDWRRVEDYAYGGLGTGGENWDVRLSTWIGLDECEDRIVYTSVVYLGSVSY